MPLDAKRMEEVVAAKSVLLRAPYMGYRPFILSNTDIEELVDELVEKRDPDDFCWAVCRDTEFLQKLCRAGFLPIATPVGGKIRSVVLPKLHRRRCVLADFDDLRVSRSWRKRAKKLDFSVDTSFDQVVDKCVEQHGMNWIGLLAKEFRDMYRNPGHGVQMHSIEVWNDDKLVAGEVGWSCGGIYTSATGFTNQSGAGSVQLCALGRLLKRCGFVAWDLGMGMQYKHELGARDIPRARFVETVRRARAVRCNLACPRTNARDVIDGPSKEEQEEEQGEQAGRKKDIQGSGEKASSDSVKMRRKPPSSETTSSGSSSSGMSKTARKKAAKLERVRQRKLEKQKQREQQQQQHQRKGNDEDDLDHEDEAEEKR